MEESQEQRYICRICSKSCVSGKSLGGHMRVHLAQISASKKAAESKVAIGMDSESGFDQNGGVQLETPSNDQSNSTFPSVEDIKNGHGNKDYEECDPSNSYELRDNPKKSWRISNPKRCISRKASCKVCNKRFPSLRALSGHMRFHSTKSKGLHQCATCGKAFDSIRAMFGHMKSHSKKSSRARGESSDNSVGLGNLCPVRKKRSRVRYKTEENPEASSFNASPSSAVFEFEEEQDAAVCLLMLSVGATESSYDDSVYFGAGSFSKSREIHGIDGSFVCDGVKAGIQETDSESLKSMSCKKPRLSVHDLEKSSPLEDSENKHGNRQTMLDKNSNSHQAIGSHIARPTLPSNISSVDKNAGHLSLNEDRIKHDDQVEHNGVRLEQGTKDYQCSTCFKFFGSGQALGGHRRAHYTVFAESKTEEKTAQTHGSGIVDNSLDLNVPLTADEDTSSATGHVGLNLWRVERGHEHEALVLTN
ncbi:uncharacterized protein [Henckelia pumila]|uniref:uncharacterized protein n=1 Tax=Henckelia pumila TaxID=405737 RepID=UPI003C6E1BED